MQGKAPPAKQSGTHNAHSQGEGWGSWIRRGLLVRLYIARPSGERVNCSGCEESTRATPATSSEYRVACICVYRPPYEWPNST